MEERAFIDDAFRLSHAACTCTLHTPFADNCAPAHPYTLFSSTQVSDGRIADRTLLCEYIGEVNFLNQHLIDQGDSLMDLLRTGRSSSSLVVSPDHHANIARFFSGINNTDPGAKKCQNVKSIRFNVDGELRVFLFVSKNGGLREGDALYYDYNGHSRKGYPTENFVVGTMSHGAGEVGEVGAAGGAGGGGGGGGGGGRGGGGGGDDGGGEGGAGGAGEAGGAKDGVEDVFEGSICGVGGVASGLEESVSSRSVV